MTESNSCMAFWRVDLFCQEVLGSLKQIFFDVNFRQIPTCFTSELPERGNIAELGDSSRDCGSFF